MDISFKNKALEKTFNSEKELNKAYGILSKKIGIRMAVLKNAANLQLVPIEKPTRRHKLGGNRKNQWAVDLDRNYRLIFEPITEIDLSEADLRDITAIKIIEVDDYH
jgi:plasmid maintenance system killer protein